MSGLKLCKFYQLFQGRFPGLCVGVNQHAKFRYPLMRQFAKLLLLCLPVLCEAGAFPAGQHANKKVDIDIGWHVGCCVGVFQFPNQPAANGWAGFVEVVSSVSPKVEPEAGKNTQQKADEVKGDDVASYGLGDLIKEHGIVLAACFLIGILCVPSSDRRK